MQGIVWITFTQPDIYISMNKKKSRLVILLKENQVKQLADALLIGKLVQNKTSKIKKTPS
jgi:hypothetical protein